MRYELSNKNTPRLLLCPSCAQIMRLAQASRFGDARDLRTYECRACGVSYIEAAPFGICDAPATDYEVMAKAS